MFAVTKRDEIDKHPWISAIIVPGVLLVALLVHSYYTKPSRKNPSPPYLSIWWFPWAYRRHREGKPITLTEEEKADFVQKRQRWHERWLTAPAPHTRSNDNNASFLDARMVSWPSREAEAPARPPRPIFEVFRHRRDAVIAPMRPLFAAFPAFSGWCIRVDEHDEEIQNASELERRPTTLSWADSVEREQQQGR
ncbi:uncharacterized protein AB675_8872 [Cyphellophora attinorum]|uniref:Uncharacterized protein n=1 Tax=Cyphellophora attinorum TaxID=1664694 RepID=A0A0N0NIU0_9EURO|nr:uncharacterized protein AB675_8872 [Phialophora attinorum]KPI36128.1 hypothetical protein AB675_8872 [Phialophora attinorum]